MDEYNTAPSGMRQVTEKEFVQNSGFFNCVPEKTQFRQMHVRSLEDPVTDENYRNNGSLIQGTCNFYSDGTGALLECDYWAGKMRYWVFGCEHHYKDLSQSECREAGIYHAGRCYHVSRCEKCGYVNAVDSSD